MTGIEGPIYSGAFFLENYIKEVKIKEQIEKRTIFERFQSNLPKPMLFQSCDIILNFFELFCMHQSYRPFQSLSPLDIFSRFAWGLELKCTKLVENRIP